MEKLETILKLLGSKKPFYDHCYYDAKNEEWHVLNKNGTKAYDKLVEIIYCLGEMGVFGAMSIENAEDIVEELDAICHNEEYLEDYDEWN